MVGVVGIAMVAFASATSGSDSTAAPPASIEPASTEASTVQLPTAIVTTTDVPSTPSSTSTSSSSTTSTTSTTTSSTTTSTTAPDRPFNSDIFDATIAAATVDLGDIAAGVAVVRNGRVVHTAAFGMEDPVLAIPATASSRFRIASVSKMFTAVAVMQLVDEGSISLDEPFTKQLGLDGPFADPRIATITVRQLMSHTSGFSAARNVFFGHGVDTWHQAADNAFGQLLQFDPGTAFQYSNTNFCLLGMLLESVTDQPFESVIRERVLEPIGIRAHLAPTFDTAKGDVVHASSPGRNYMEVLGPAGGWVATPADMARLAAALRDPSSPLLDQTTVDAMRVPVTVPVEVPPPLNGWSYGLGLILFGDGSWGHTGTIESTHSIVINRPDGLTVAVLVSGKVPGNTDHLQQVIDLAVAAAST
jgi:D-alanyl-D-alanine carboxypeptidase